MKENHPLAIKLRMVFFLFIMISSNFTIAKVVFSLEIFRLDKFNTTFVYFYEEKPTENQYKCRYYTFFTIN